jgi:hypothetical protein
MVFYMVLLTAFSFLDGQKKRKKDAAREPWRGTAGGAVEDRRREGGGMAGGVAAVLWCYLNQRYILIRFCGGCCWVCLSYFAPLKKCTVDPVGSWPEVVRLVAGCMAGDTPHPSSTDGTI